MQAAEINVVHESEVQRRHSRLKIPCELQIDQKNGEVAKFDILDLSASGFAIEDADNTFDLKKSYQGKLSFTLDGMQILVPVGYQVAYADQEQKKKGCEFHELGRKEISILRLIINKYISGDVVDLGDALITISRDNFAKQRGEKSSSALSGSAKIKALAMTLLVFSFGLLAFTFVISSVYQTFFVTKATSAVISIDSEMAVAPREGYIHLLVEEGQSVSIGEPLATIDSPLLEMIEPILGNSDISREELMTMMQSSVSSVIQSRCNCRVIDVRALEGKYLVKGEAAIHLAPQDALPVVEAHFSFSNLEKVTPGSVVSMSFGDGEPSVTGVVGVITVPEGVTDPKQLGTFIASITPDQPLDFSLIGRPLTVQLSDFVN